ncbi:Permease of the drug/metabolite transporter superfamily [Pseudomonas syringae pv. actinidiae]|uniref:Permease of the drug/metabolite transporter superfamily n=1 Tax=Pseudomonas syringae pv. actinidiae TaxID=103796 RepID=A0A2V0Q5J1_PSESF|nr:Permease of the drug/metabolite transporter superfamily [Pseudomonas syringae pv. actinidiae]
MHLNLSHLLVDHAQIVIRQLQFNRAKILLQPMLFGRARDRHNPRFLRQQPCECYLRRRGAFALRDGFHHIDQRQVGLTRLSRKTGDKVAEVAGFKLGVLIDLPREEACAKWTKRNEANTQFLQCAKEFLFRASPEQRIFALHRRHWLHRMCPANSLHARFG